MKEYNAPTLQMASDAVVMPKNGCVCSGCTTHIRMPEEVEEER